MTRRRKLLQRCCILFLFGCLPIQSTYATNPLSEWDSWIRETPPGARVTAAYLQVKNESAQPRILTGVSSKSFNRIEMHESFDDQGMAKMRQHTRIHIAAGTRISFAPGGLHLMLFEPTKPLRAGDQVTLLLRFDNAIELPVIAQVKRVDLPESSDHTHHHH